MAKYTVTYYIKSGGREHECDMQVEADNAAEACKLVKDIVKEETGRNAFRAKAKKISNSYRRRAPCLQTELQTAETTSPESRSQSSARISGYPSASLRTGSRS